MTTAIQTSIHGSRFGLSKDNQLVVQGADGGEYAVTPIPEAGNEVAGTLVAASVGAVASVSGLACNIDKKGNVVTLDFTFTAVQLPHTDAAGSGSSGSLKLFDFVQQSVLCLGSRSDLLFTGDALIDTNAGDIAFVYGFGSAAANAADGDITGTEVDYAAKSGTITSSSHIGTSASLLKGAGTPVDGTSTAADVYLNESATAATSDANGFFSVTGTARLVFLLLGDD